MARLIFVVSLIVVMLGGHALAQDKGFGSGILFAEPTRLSDNLWLWQTTAIDGATSWSSADEDRIQSQADVLCYKFDLFNVKGGELPVYLGGEGSMKFEVDDRDTRYGAPFPVPVGIDYIFAEAPLDIFFELVPVFDLARSPGVVLNGAVGVRYFFR